MSTPTPLPSLSGPELFQIGISVFSLVLVAIQVYLVFRVDKARLKLEKFTGLTEKFDLEVKPEAHGIKELLEIDNKGSIPIKELLVKIDLIIERENKPIISSGLKWRRKHQFNPNEKMTITLHEKLKGLFEENELIKTVEGMTEYYNDPDTGEDMEYTAHPAWLQKPFTLMLNLQVEANIEGEITTVIRKYRLDYSWLDNFQEGIDDNYGIAVSDQTGEWIE